MNRLFRIILEREMNKMLTNIWAHPKTTLAGIGLAVLHVLANGRTWQSIALAIFTAILGAIAKDPNSTH